MSSQYVSPVSLGHEIFDKAAFGDLRRNDRLACLFDIMKRHPGVSFPDKFAKPADLRALYRLLSSKGVTHQSVIEAVRNHTMLLIAACPDAVLFLHDATELDYSTLNSLADDLSQIGKGNRQGYICQNVLAVNARTGVVLGLVDQVLHNRVKKPKGETAAEHRNRKSRESLLWLHGTKHLPADCEFVDVCDRGADTFEFLKHEHKSGRSYVIRSCKIRTVYAGHEVGEQKQFLADFAANLPALGGFTMDVQSRPGRTGDKKRESRTARRAEFTIQAGPALVCRPHSKKGHYDNDPIPLYVVRVCETNTPAGQDPISWTLLTNKPVTNLEQAWEVAEIYEKRWIIEELHKGMKTGCKIEDIQFTTVDRLQPAIALLTTVAVTLLNLRDISRMPNAESIDAKEVLDSVYVTVLSLWRFNEARDLSVHDFFYALARLGGHQNRSSDSQPGWIVIWRGWAKLQFLIIGYRAAKDNKCGKT